ncbi:FMI1 protein [Apiospora hydei]|uniref:FMI1 protein n=1 Tax=Apiospora hydei TaxID=1337664 RepID=A0ABR1V8K5_9PEZI
MTGISRFTSSFRASGQGRMRGVRNCTRCLSNISNQAAHLHHSPRVVPNKALPDFSLQPVQGRAFSASTTAQRSSSSTAPGSGPKSKTKSRRRPLVLSIGAATVLAASWYALGSETKDESLNDTRFTAFDVVSNEPVSPTAFVLTIRSRDSELAKNSAKLKAAWEHDCAPLHAFAAPGGEDGTEARLRFLVRKMQGGEMSNYLSRMQVGSQVWLRGPHHGFDIPKRLGNAREIVFLAGGTGIAPALQMVHKLLDTSSVDGFADNRPSIRILWANRRSFDCVARDELQGKRKADDKMQSVLLRQILEMKREHGNHFSIDYYVDDEKKLIGIKDVDAALRNAGAAKAPLAHQPADKSCRWHSTELLAVSMDEDDGQIPDVACACALPSAGRKIICVSGPDGFIEAFAGPKRWVGGRELQGPVQGVLGTIKRQSKGAMDDWLVLKM